MVPAVFNVGAGDVATLIADIKTANSNDQTNTINLTDSTYDFTSAVNDTFGPNALPVITGSIIINGNGAVLERDPSSSPFRFFYVSGGTVANPSSSTTSTNDATGSLMLDDLTLEGGLAEGDSSGTGGGGLGAGGAILNLGNLYLNAVTLEQNVAEGGSSGVGTSTSGGGLGGSTAGNFGEGGLGSGVGVDGGVGGGGGAGTTPGDGGFGAGDGNASEGGGGMGAGGAIFDMYGTTTLINCTLASNEAEGGQGANEGAGYGGAIFNLDSTLDVISSTIADNTITGFGAVNSGGAIYNLAMGTTSADAAVPSTVTLTDSILADSIGSNDLVNNEDSDINASALVNATMPNIITSYNTMVGATTNGTPMTINPLLSPLANNGGQTPTMALQSGSPALGAGAAGANVPTVDQRGVARGSVIDLGAYQATPASAVATTLSFTVSDPATTTGATVTITATVTQASGSTVPAGTVQFTDATTGKTLGSATLSNGQATLTTTSVSSGDTITGTFLSSNGMGDSIASATVAAASSSGGSSSSSSGGDTNPTSTTLSTVDQQWLNQVYVALLHRPIDSNGLSAWGAALNAGTSPTQVVYDIEHTSEFETDEIQSAFQKLLGVAAPSSAVTYLVGLMQGGADIQTIEAIIAGTPEFYAAAGGTNDAFLNALYEDFLNRPVDPTGEAAWNALMNAGYSNTQVALGILNSKEYLTDLVNQDYQTYVGVAPDASSLSAFVAALQKGTTSNDMIVASLLGSPEYVALYGLS